MMISVIEQPCLHGPGCRPFRDPPGSSSLRPIMGRWVLWDLFGPSRKKRFLPFHLVSFYGSAVILWLCGGNRNGTHSFAARKLTNKPGS